MRFKPTLPILLVMILMIVGLGLRLWNFTPTFMFQGDQARDALIVADIVKKGDLVFIGPVTSVGNMYLGPLYYYFMAPFLALTYPNPMGPAFGVMILGLATIGLLYFLGREMIGSRAALFASLMATFSAILVTYSRFSWNPNPEPFVSLIMVWATFRAWQRDARFWVVVGLCLSVLSQLHYVSLLAAGGAGLIWMLQLYQIIKTKRHLKTFILSTAGAALIFLLSFTPLVLFDLKHEGLNRQAFFKLFTEEEIFNPQDSPSLLTKVGSILSDTHGRSMTILFDHALGKHRELNTILLIATLGALILILNKSKKNFRYQNGLVVLLAYLATGIIGTAFYQHNLYYHYILYLFPIVFLVQGLLLDWLAQKKIGWIAVAIYLVLFLKTSFETMPYDSQSWTIVDVKNTSQQIYDNLKVGEKYSLVLLSPSKDLYAQNYRYFLSTTDKPPLPPERSGEAETLVVINEQHEPNVASLPIYEIVIFPSKTTSEAYTIPNGPEVLFFRH